MMGGPHVSFCVEEALSHADFCVIGEGEEPAVALVECLEKYPIAGSPAWRIAMTAVSASGQGLSR